MSIRPVVDSSMIRVTNMNRIGGVSFPNTQMGTGELIKCEGYNGGDNRIKEVKLSRKLW